MKIFGTLLTLTLLALCSNAQTIESDAVDGELHLKLSTDPGFILDGYTGGNLTLDPLFAVSGLDSIYRPFPMPGTTLDSIYRVVFPNAAQVNTLITALEALPFVEYAEKNPIVFESNTPNDLQTDQWYLNKIQAELGWDYSTGSVNVLVAVLDDAIAIDHEDLASNIYVNTAEQNGLTLLDDDLNGQPDDINGYDVADRDNNPRPPANASGNGDGFAHGTHVAGILSATTNNSIGIASIGYNTKILPVKIGRDADAALTGSTDGIYYAMRSGVDIMNFSWGTLTDSQVLRSLILQVQAAGILMVAAAGNDGDQTVVYPAAYPEVMSVGSTNENDQRSSFSNYGSTISVMAPGTNIYSTLPEGNDTYGNNSGTSMATPLVAGLAALVKANFPSFTANQIQERIEMGCDDISAQNPGLSGQIGSGRINAFQTLGNVGIVDFESSAFSIYPNPTNSLLQLHFEGKNKPYQVTIIDAAGRVVYQVPFQFTHDLADLEKGVYHVVIESKKGRLSSKLVLQ